MNFKLSLLALALFIFPRVQAMQAHGAYLDTYDLLRVTQNFKKNRRNVEIAYPCADLIVCMSREFLHHGATEILAEEIVQEDETKTLGEMFPGAFEGASELSLSKLRDQAQAYLNRQDEEARNTGQPKTPIVKVPQAVPEVPTAPAAAPAPITQPAPKPAPAPAQRQNSGKQPDSDSCTVM